MKISIITATYNSAATVRDTLTSVRGQDHPDIEHLVIDGGSTDATGPIVTDFPHVSKFVSEPDNGIYDAMNKGILLAQGDVIGILNSDDIYADDAVLSDVARVFEDPAVMTVYADLHYVMHDDLTRIKRVWHSGVFRRNYFYYGWMPPHPTFFVRKEVYEKVGLFNTSLRTSADYELMLRILLKHGFSTRYIRRVTVKMRVGGASNATLRNRFRGNREDRLAWKLNDLKPYFFTLYLKPLRKITQFMTM